MSDNQTNMSSSSSPVFRFKIENGYEFRIGHQYQIISETLNVLHQEGEEHSEEILNIPIMWSVSDIQIGSRYLELLLEIKEVVDRINQCQITADNYISLKTLLVLRFNEWNHLKKNDFIDWLQINISPSLKLILNLLSKDDIPMSDCVEMTTVSEFMFCPEDTRIFAMNQFIQKPEPENIVDILKTLQFVLRGFNFNSFNHLLLNKACIVGNLNAAEYLWEISGKKIENISTLTVEKTTQNGKLETLQWLDSKGILFTLENSVSIAIRNNSRDILDWLFLTKPELKNENLLMHATVYSSLELIQDMVIKYGYEIRAIHLENGCYRGELELCKFLYHQGRLNPTMFTVLTYTNAILSKNPEIIAWLVHLSAITMEELVEMRVLEAAINHCRYQTLEWLFENGIPTDRLDELVMNWINNVPGFISEAKEPESLETLQLLVKRGYDVHQNHNYILFKMATRQYFEIVRWIMDHADEVGNTDFSYHDVKGSNALTWTCKYKRLELAKRLHLKGLKLEYYVYMYWISKEKDLPLGDWLRSVESSIINPSTIPPNIMTSD